MACARRARLRAGRALFRLADARRPLVRRLQGSRHDARAHRPHFRMRMQRHGAAMLENSGPMRRISSALLGSPMTPARWPPPLGSCGAPRVSAGCSRPRGCSSPRRASFWSGISVSPEIRATLAAWGMHLDFSPDIAGGALFPYLESMANQSFGMVIGRGRRRHDDQGDGRAGSRRSAARSQLECRGGGDRAGKDGRAVGIRLPTESIPSTQARRHRRRDAEGARRAAAARRSAATPAYDTAMRRNSATGRAR